MRTFIRWNNHTSLRKRYSRNRNAQTKLLQIIKAFQDQIKRRPYDLVLSAFFRKYRLSESPSFREIRRCLLASCYRRVCKDLKEVKESRSLSEAQKLSRNIFDLIYYLPTVDHRKLPQYQNELEELTKELS